MIGSDTNETADVVLKLGEPLLHKGYLVWTCKFYSTPDQAKLRKSKKTDRTVTSKTKQEVQ
jgi:hypothetical protein